MILDLFAGPGGWSEGLRALGLEDVGIEWDAAACATRRAAGHATIRADVSQYPTEPFAGKVEGLIASPPCTAFSAAGKKKGRRHVPALLAAVAARDWSARPDPDPTVWLVLEVGRWVEALRPEWIACEQVPEAIDIWNVYQQWLRTLGYSTWAGVINTADLGVPQTRERAILMASRVAEVQPPAPTHARQPEASLFGPALSKWITMAEAIGWPDGFVLDRRQTGAPLVNPSTEPCPTLTAAAVGKTVWKVYEHPGAWALDRPATTVTGDPRISPPCHHDKGQQLGQAIPLDDVFAWATKLPATTIVGSFCPDVVSPPGYRGPGDGPRQSQPGAIKITLPQGCVLQSFDADYPLQGSKTKKWQQLGNAVPPLMAQRVIAALTGLEREAVAA